MNDPLSAPVHDEAALRLTRAALRRCYVEIDAISRTTRDTSPRVVAEDLKIMANDLTNDIEGMADLGLTTERRAA